MIKKPTHKLIPKQSVPIEQISHIENWVSDSSLPVEAQLAKESIPKLSGRSRGNYISKLLASTDYRINKTGVIEVLLHRGMGCEEASCNMSIKSQYPVGCKTSWTPNIKVAHRQAYYESPRGKVVSAWIPESCLYSYIGQYADIAKSFKAVIANEEEWIVEHTLSFDIDKVADPINPRKLRV